MVRAVHRFRCHDRNVVCLVCARDRLEVHGVYFPCGACWLRVSLLGNAQGNVRVTKLAKQWTRTDALAAPTYGAAPVWRATAPGLFRNLIVRAESIPSSSSQFFLL